MGYKGKWGLWAISGLYGLSCLATEFLAGSLLDKVIMIHVALRHLKEVDALAFRATGVLQWECKRETRFTRSGDIILEMRHHIKMCEVPIDRHFFGTC